MRIGRSGVAGWLWLLVAASLLVGARPASAMPALLAPVAAIEPRDIALTLDDLPPGFAVDPSHTGNSNVDGVGPQYEVQYIRDVTPGDIMAGPIVVGQIVIRLDGAVGAGDALLGTRERLIESGFTPTSVGPNDGGTYTLRKADAQADGTVVGFIKENVIIVTIAAGAPGVVNYQSVLRLAGISSGRMDATLGH